VDTTAVRAALPAVPAEDVLDDLFPAFMLEVHIDVWRLIPLMADKAFEQQVDPGWIQLRDTQGETDCRVGGRAAPLAEDPLLTCEANDVVHRQEVALIGLVGDQLQLFLDLSTQAI
jgi:hypothetical protein